MSSRPSQHLSRRSVIVLCLSSVMVLGCGSVTREIEQTSVREASAEITVKAALIDDQSVDAASIQVLLSDETIVLSGFVGSQEESDTAEELARQNASGYPVTNSLEVR